MGDPLDQMKGAPGNIDGQRTAWETMSIGEVLGILAKMGRGNASGDAEAFAGTPGLVKQAVNQMNSAFGTDLMLGRAADGSVTRARLLANAIDTSATRGQQVVDAVERGGQIAGDAAALAPQFQALQEHVRDNPEDSAAARAAVRAAMDSTYSNPMLAAQANLPAERTDDSASRELSNIGNLGSTDPNNPNRDNSSNSRGQTANTTDITGGGPNGPGSGPTPTGGPSPSSNSPNRTTPVDTTNTNNPSRQNPGSPDRNPDSLNRGGRGTPNVVPANIDNRHPPGPGKGAPNNIPRGGVPAGLVPGGPRSPVIPPGLVPPAGAPGGATNPGAGTPNSNPGAAQRPGTPGVPHGAGRPRSDDKKHTPAIYLHSDDNGKEIVGDLPLVGPPVIGDWAPRAAPAASVPAPNETVADEGSVDLRLPTPTTTPAPEKPVEQREA
ncbi:hypothetical protein [Gordonia sp. ABSL49_1]|uniref:hypothetical protein n=1 Tax=Gordonia sp. ABSL49_1 TaxID=2920941 RepID=UPI001F114C4B|nr:hypothetical protein [Gordonia sp. ABSL49_1]MCH5643588.1 hypothetical protein [Gordonia sp. ABSL49_1]